MSVKPGSRLNDGVPFADSGGKGFPGGGQAVDQASGYCGNATRGSQLRKKPKPYCCIVAVIVVCILPN